MPKKSRVRSRLSIAGVTPYPWRRNYTGDLCGADGQPICFQGPDAVMVEHSPQMAEILETIRATAMTSTANPRSALGTIFRLADEQLSRMETANWDHKWCRGTVR